MEERMDSRERLLTALDNEKADHLPAQVHSWMSYYLRSYLGGCDQYAAYERFGLDAVIYVSPERRYSPSDLDNWRVDTADLGVDRDGVHQRVDTVTTPGGTLTRRRAANPFTEWDTEPVIKTPTSRCSSAMPWFPRAPIPRR
jgi:uroporphyrinogen decarboxylase